MLRIEVPSNGPAQLSFSKFQRLNLPIPQGGLDQEINDALILSFEDEQEAINYSLEMDHYANSLNDHDSADYLTAIEIINAINEDGFVQSYLRS